MDLVSLEVCMQGREGGGSREHYKHKVICYLIEALRSWVGVLRQPSGYQLEVTCTAPCHLKQEGDAVCFAWGTDNAHMLKDGKLRSFSPGPSWGKGKLCVWKVCHLKALFITCLNCYHLQWREVDPLFLRKQSNRGLHWRQKRTALQGTGVPLTEVFCKYTAKCRNLFSVHPPAWIIMKPFLLRSLAGHSLT